MGDYVPPNPFSPFAASDVCAAGCYYKSLDRIIGTRASSEIICRISLLLLY